MSLRWALVDRVLRRFDPPTQAKLHWREQLRAGVLHARLMSKLVEPGDVAIDIGANWGLYAIGLSELVGNDGHVIAVEPGAALPALRAACRRRRNIEILAVALSDRDGRGSLTLATGSESGASALARLVEPGFEGRAMDVKLARLDSLELPNSSRLTFIKCDVEGHEDAVLRGAERRIRDRMPSLLVEIEERHRDRPVCEAFDLVLSWGYVGFALTEAGLRPLDQFDIARDQQVHLLAGELPSPKPPAYINDFLFVREEVAPRISGDQA